MTMNETLKTFGYPETCVADFNFWAITLRSKQVTLGSCVIICKEGVTSLGDISSEASTELQKVIFVFEKALRLQFDSSKFNYLALMMVDPNVHFHAIPRYHNEKNFEGVVFQDTGWPKAPDMGNAQVITDEVKTKLYQVIKNSLKKLI